MLTKIYLVTNCYGDSNKVYIGKEKSHKIIKRVNQHLIRFGENINFGYIDECKGWDKKDWKPLECFWIEQFRQWGFDIQNKNKGGGGPEFRSEETKLKISKANTGKKRSNLTKKRMSRSIKKGLKDRKFLEHWMDPQRKSVLQFDKKENFIKKWRGVSIAAENLNINKSDIAACSRGKLKTAGGFIWKYK